jgi:hypothetical protein
MAMKMAALIAGVVFAIASVCTQGRVPEPTPFAIVAAGLFVSAAILHAGERGNKDDTNQ